LSRIVEIESTDRSAETGFAEFVPDVDAVIGRIDDEQSLLTKEELMALQVNIWLLRLSSVT
jgi:hypothetical protein